MSQAPPSAELFKEDRKWLELAIEQAKLAGQDVPVGCVIVHDGNVIAQACNQREGKQDPAGHAEILAMRQAATSLGRWRLTGCTIYSTLEPCAMCAEAMIQARVSRVVYGAYDPASGAAGSFFNLFVPGRIYPLPEVLGGISEETCRTLLIDFFRTNSADTQS